MSDSAVQPSEADARELAAKLGEFQAGLPEGQKALFERLMVDATGSDEVQGFATMSEYALLLTLITLPFPNQQPGGASHPGVQTQPGTTRYGH